MIPLLRARIPRSRYEVPLFGQERRRVRVMVDADFFLEAGHDSSDALLRVFLSHPEVEVWWYRSGGPRADEASWVPSPWRAGESTPEGWPLLEKLGAGPEHDYRVTFTSSDRTGSGKFFGAPLQRVREDRGSPAYAELTGAQAEEKRVEDFLALGAADALEADLYVTAREYLHASTLELARNTTICRGADALAVIGLVTRQRGDFFLEYQRSPGSTYTARTDKGTFFRVGAAELLPEWWRWCAASSVAPSDASEFVNPNSVVERLSQALQCRDQLLIAMNSDRLMHADVHLALDSCLLFLMAALDCAARYAHHALGLTTTSRQAGWQNEKWLKKVSHQAPGLPEVVAPNTTGWATLELLKTLRNNVHSEGFGMASWREFGQDDQLAVALPRSNGDQLVRAIDLLGGAQHWEWRSLGRGAWHANPHSLVELLVPLVAELLNSLMAATPTDGLVGARGLRSDECQPPTHTPPHGEPFDEKHRQSVRWQLGY